MGMVDIAAKITPTKNVANLPPSLLIFLRAVQRKTVATSIGIKITTMPRVGKLGFRKSQGPRQEWTASCGIMIKIQNNQEMTRMAIEPGEERIIQVERYR